MIRLRGGRLVLPDRVVDGAALILHEGTIVEIGPDHGESPHDVRCDGQWLLPGFIDGHIHGVEGTDVLSGAAAVARVAAALPRHGVTAFCPTTIACTPAVLERFLIAVAAAADRPAGAARVLGAHLESNFLNPDYNGAQPVTCLRRPPRPGEPAWRDGDYTGTAIVEVIDRHRPAVRLVTLAPELDGALDLIGRLVHAGHRVSLGHSAATFEQGQAGIAAGARHATHLFNRMPPLAHRAPGLAGAVLAHDEVTCEILCDGFHVHPAMVRFAVRAKGVAGALAITDATAGAGLPVGAESVLGDQPIRVTERCAVLADGTLAGSILTMDGAFRLLVGAVGLDVVEAARLCATTPAQALGRPDLGRLAVGAAADVVALDAAWRVRQTWIAGVPAWNPSGPPAVSEPGRA
ncbi:MAG: N-acetylglucosamine-6-phosphate deacetylase [Vicinamibacterales bacterium]